MKRLLLTVLLLMFIIPPVFATGDYYEGCNDNITYTPNNGVQDYYTKLKKQYREKYVKDIDATHSVNNSPVGAYDREVIVPLLDYMIANPVKLPSK